jgi:hypothetical protein
VNAPQFELSRVSRSRFVSGLFLESDFVFRFNRPISGRATNPFIFNMVFGLAFFPLGGVPTQSRLGIAYQNRNLPGLSYAR